MTLFPFDPTGRLHANRIQNESHTVTAINGVDHNYLIPKNAPFYNASMTVVNAVNGETLSENVDFYFGYSFADATEKTGLAVSGAIIFIDPLVSGQYLLNYQTVGGEYVNEETRAIENGLDALDRLVNPDWSDIVNVPAVFPPTPHMLRLDEVVGVAEIIARLDEIEIAIRDRPRRLLTSDIVDLEETYTQPLLQAMGEIAQAVQGITESSVVQYLHADTLGEELYIVDVLPGEWYPTGASVTVTSPGVYQLNVSSNALAIDTESTVPAKVRFTVDGVEVSQSHMSSTILGLAAGNILSLEVSVPGGQYDRINAGGTTYGCGLTLIRVSD